MPNLKHAVAAERWAALVKERMDSGMTIEEWCRERNIKKSQYYYWLKILRQDEANAAGQGPKPPSFVELPAICQKQEPQPGMPAAVIRKGDIYIEITESASAGFLAKVMEAVSHAW